MDFVISFCLLVEKIVCIALVEKLTIRQAVVKVVIRAHKDIGDHLLDAKARFNPFLGFLIKILLDFFAFYFN
ncbi:MAG: hypothetical protein JWQ54_4701 [Mucilaginibacter sp.]|nr:hypothetical protein [Mucilaginibacter sp.]